MSLYDPNRIVHYRLEGKHARPLCKCKLRPGIRPRMLSCIAGGTLPPPIKPDGEGVWSGTCSSCYEIAQRLMAPRTPSPSAPSQYERDRRDADAYADARQSERGHAVFNPTPPPQIGAEELRAPSPDGMDQGV